MKHLNFKFAYGRAAIVLVFAITFQCFLAFASEELDPIKMAEGFYNAPNCDFKQPSADCIKKIMVPLSEAKDLPFDKEVIAKAYDDFGPYVAPQWQVTTLHRLPNLGGMKPQDCALENFRYSDEPFYLLGCGTFLFIGGHPVLKTCTRINPLSCTALAPPEESPDISLFKANPRADYLPVASTKDLMAGDIVYLVHSPFFKWFPYEEGQKLYHKGPYVTEALFIAETGRTAAVLAPSFQGSSGGTVLNSKGQVLGVLSKGAKSVPLTWFQRLDDRMLEIIEKAATAGRDSDK